MAEKIKKYIPHFIAILLFLGLTVVYFYPIVLENKDLVQGDVTSVEGWGKDLKDYHKKTGDYAFWSNSMFGGMPANYTFMPSMFNVFSLIYKLVAAVLPLNHLLLVFLYLIGFYIFMLSIGCKPWLSMIGAIAYAFTSYNLIIIGAGHVNKALVMATMAPVLGGIVMCYRKKYIWGTIVTLVFTGLNVYWGHQQISYYLLIVILILAIVYLIYAIKEKTLKDYFISSAILLVVACLAVAPEAGNLMSTADYAKDTMRGGAVLKNNPEGKKESTGLDIDYAYAWSYGVGETMTLLIPNIYGASSGYNIGEDSEFCKLLKNAGYGSQAAQQSKHAPMYWGDQPFTSGPVYVGAIVCFLFILGLFVVKGPEKWWLLAATIVAIIMSWGRHFPLVNDFLFYNLPLYNKFRIPSMSLVIAEVTMVCMAILALKEILQNKDNRNPYITSSLFGAAGVTGGICLLFALFGGALMSFSAASDANYQPELLEAIVSDRKHMMSSDAWRSFIFILLSAGAIWLYLTKNVKTGYILLTIGLLIFIDLWSVDKRFLNYDNFVPKKKAKEIVASSADQHILQDKDPNYRVLNMTSSPFNESMTSYFHKSIGGYSPAKLRRYQDIIDYHFSKGINVQVLNMLNAKYIIAPTEQGPQVQRNPEALGNAWFVSQIQWVNSPDEEILALNDFNSVQTAIVDKIWQDKITNPGALQHVGDSSAMIRLTDYANPGYLIYESSSTQPNLAVFSEVYYKTWRAYIDGVEAPLIQVNYILRGLEIPAGNHKIEFKCIDEIYERGASISLISSIIVGIILMGMFGFAIWHTFFRKKEFALE